ncbi:MAG: sensor histidine kinase [Clostridia bacterium]
MGAVWTWHIRGGAGRFLEPLILLVLAVGGGLAAYITGRFTRRLERLSRSVEAINLRDLAVRVPVEGADSVAMLARAFNRMLDRLESEERVRRELFADVAHEIRHPLAGIRARLDAMQDGALPLDQEQILRVSDAAGDLARLVGDLRDLSLADVGQLRLDRIPVDVWDLVGQIQEWMEPVAEDQGIALTTTVASGLPQVLGDSARLRQVLLNLITNALRHTPAGGSVALSVVSTGRDVVFRITDSGQGIAPGDLPHIFERFFRADRARTRSEGAGSGLGLAIVRSLVELHGGRVTAASTPGVGSVFTITIPGAGVQAPS